LQQFTEPAQCTEGRLSLRGTSASSATASLVQFSRPDDRGIVEFLSCPTIVLQHAGLIAWRIDGESMAPRYGDGDFVLVNPIDPAAEGHPCVAHQRGQLGVNCKIFQCDGSDVVLIPVNEQYPLQRFPAAELVWAHRVQFSVRLKR
jgi:SOS-response transcriptional repressor LexA